MTDHQGDRGDRGLEGQRGARGDAGHQGDAGDAGLQGDRGLEGQRGHRGDTGMQGITGAEGERGADSESVEVLAEVLDKLTVELVGLREDVRTERRGRRLSMAVIAVAIIVAAVVGAVGYSNYRTLSEQQEVEIQANKYDQQAGLNDACLANNDDRDSRRRLFINLYDLVESAPPPVPRTPAEQKFIDDFLVEARGDVVAETVLIDCEAVAPRPEGERPS